MFLTAIFADGSDEVKNKGRPSLDSRPGVLKGAGCRGIMPLPGFGAEPQGPYARVSSRSRGVRPTAVLSLLRSRRSGMGLGAVSNR